MQPTEADDGSMTCLAWGLRRVYIIPVSSVRDGWEIGHRHFEFTECTACQIAATLPPPQPIPSKGIQCQQIALRLM